MINDFRFLNTSEIKIRYSSFVIQKSVSIENYFEFVFNITFPEASTPLLAFIKR